MDWKIQQTFEITPDFLLHYIPNRKIYNWQVTDKTGEVLDIFPTRFKAERYIGELEFNSKLDEIKK